MFSWSNGTGTNSNNSSARLQSSTYPAVRGSVRPPEYSRQQHLDSYVGDETLKKSTRKVSADDSTYDTVFQTVSGATLILRVQMPPSVHPNAPVRRPNMTLAGLKARHSWLDDRMQVVGFPPIQSDEAWRSSRLLLGAAVHQVIQQLQVNPPDIIEITDKGLRNIQPKQNGMASFDNNQRRTQPLSHATLSVASRKSMSQAPRSTHDPPDYDASFSVPTPDVVQLPRQFDEIESLSLSRIQELLNDELEFMAFCHGLPSMQSLLSKGQERFNANVAKATIHLAQKDALDALSQEVTSLRDSLKERIATFQELQRRQDALLAPPDENIALRELAVEKKQGLLESERLAEEWLEQGADQPLAFVKEFVERRKQHHLAAAKIEVMHFQRKQSR